MLDLGFPVDIPEMNHGYTPLHNAAWDGNTDLVKLLIERGHPVNVPDPNYDSTPSVSVSTPRLRPGEHHVITQV